VTKLHLSEEEIIARTPWRKRREEAALAATKARAAQKARAKADFEEAKKVAKKIAKKAKKRKLFGKK
jgi:ribosomal protein L18